MSGSSRHLSLKARSVSKRRSAEARAPERAFSTERYHRDLEAVMGLPGNLAGPDGHTQVISDRTTENVKPKACKIA